MTNLEVMIGWTEKELANKKALLLADLDRIKQSVERMERYLQANETPGLGEQLQNVWNLYRNMGEYEQLVERAKILKGLKPATDGE